MIWKWYQEMCANECTIGCKCNALWTCLLVTFVILLITIVNSLNPDQARLNVGWGLIWIQTVGHSDVLKSKFWKISRRQTRAKLLTMWVYTVYLYCFQNQSASLRFPQFVLSICIVFRTSLPASYSLSLHCVFVLFSEPVSQPQIPSVYTVYLYCFQNQSSSVRFPQFTLSICIVFRTSLPASDSSVYTVYLYCFQNQSPSLRFPQFTLSICIVFKTSLPASDSFSLHCLFVLFSEPVSKPQIPSVYIVYLYCFQNQSPNLRFLQFTLSICIVFRTSLPASDSLSLHCLFVLFSEPVSKPQIPSVYIVYLYCFQNQSPSLRFP